MESSWRGAPASLPGDGRHAAARLAFEYVPSGFPAGRLYGASMSGVVGALNGAASRPTAMPTRGAQVSHSAVHCTDTPAAAEWRALYGASADMMSSAVSMLRSGGAGVSYMTPIFHLTAEDATIVSMEHNNHCKLLGMATSKNEIFVTWTQLMPVIGNIGVLQEPHKDPFGDEQAALMYERLLKWDPANMSILIDQLPYTCTELSWAPWQQGIYLAGLCPGHGIRLYRYSHGHWALDDCIRSTESVSCSISTNFTVACACSGGRVELWARGSTAPGTGATSGPSRGSSAESRAETGGVDGARGTSWGLCSVLTFPFTEEDDGDSRVHEEVRVSGISLSPASATRHRPRDVLSLSWDESGALLAAGDQGGSVYIVAATQGSSRLGEVLYHQTSFASSGFCKQVSWSPSSGRSFLCLAMVFRTCVRLVLFRRPRFMNAAGLPQVAHSVSVSGGGGGGARAGGAHGSGGPIIDSALQVLASTQVPCREVSKLSWNNTGTRFVTAHLDSSVNNWAVDFRYQHPSEVDGVNAAGSREKASKVSNTDSARAGGHVVTSVPSTAVDKRLGIVVSVRRTSAVHPYHAVSM
ncbi:hypothetical protein JKF63_01820 [Porcisia hertigi]|uniref:Uncharacterized protein n=1 Tax=Porcisia hertigi TaxID=2761500 RepID=A0A836L1P9_9TRYP|nr:hypothetical protein JKF63_01820 [Porcisia hertigi]